MIFKITIAYIIGIIGGLYKNIFFIVPFLMLILIGLYKNKTIKKYMDFIFKIKNKKNIIYIIVFVIGLINITYLEYQFENKYKDVENLSIIATVVNNGENKDYKTVYRIKVGEGEYKNTYLLLNIKKKDDVRLKYGDKIYIKGEFESPNVARNYGGFSYRDYLKTKKVYGIVNSSKENIKIIKRNNVNIISRVANSLSNKIIENVDKVFSEEEAGLLKGILIGNKETLDENVEENFKDSNLSHMLAVSGAHVSYIILGITTIFSKSKISKRISKIITILILLFFILLVGSTPSVIRACIMAIYIIVATLVYRKPSMLPSLSVSLIIILIYNPYLIFDIGLLLSYGGTIGIILFANRFIKQKENDNKSKLQKMLNYIKQMFIVSISANIIILPIMAYNFNTISLTFFISNILAGPILGIVVILGFIYIIISIVFSPLAEILSVILNIFLKILILIADVSSKIPFSKIYVKTPSIVFIICYYLGICLFLWVISKSKKYKFEKKLISIIKSKRFISILIIIVLLFQIIKINSNNFTIHFIDVGQGDSTLITTTSRKNILIDGGGSESFDVGEQTLLPYLLDRGITKLHYCIISHFDTDHVGGILSILDKIKIEKIIISKQGENSDNYQEFLEKVKKEKIKVILVKKSDVLKIDKDVSIEILWPKEEQIVQNILNNNSIVAKLTYNKFSMLLTGDIEQIAEEEILREYKNTLKLKSTVLKVAHHGSKSSTIQEFLGAVNPKIALIGVGAKNTFGHPNDGVIQRLENLRYEDL